jgi:hypothetical protein
MSLSLITGPIANEAMKVFQPLQQAAAAIGPAFEVGCAFR